MNAPMEKNIANQDGSVSDHYVRYVGERAQSGLAVVGTEAAYVRVDGKARANQLGIHEDYCVGGIERLAQEAHRHDVLLAVEINHAGRVANPRVSGLQPVAPSPIPCAVTGGVVPATLEPDEVPELVEAYAQAARRCRAAGVDIITIHAGHGYLVHQFMSPRTNRRQDRYGRPTAFLDEVVAAVVREAGGLLVSLRVSALEGVEGGLTADTTLAMLQEAELSGVDLVDVSAGCYEAGEWMIQSGEWKQGFLAPIARKFRALGKPISVAGRINSRLAAEVVLARGDADFVSVARGMHAAADWFSFSSARRIEPRPCIACNYCSDQLALGRAAACSVNPAVVPGGPSEIVESLTGKGVRVCVVGGGPAGLEAARELAKVGCYVTLAEMSSRIGGQFALASDLHEYPEYRRILDWYGTELRRLGVSLLVGVEVDESWLRLREFDAVVVATGARGIVPAVPGVDGIRVFDVREWLGGAQSRTLVDAPYLVWGSDRETLAVADDLADRGCRVVVVVPDDELARDVGRRAKSLVLPRVMSHESIEVLTKSTVVAIDATTVTIASPQGEYEIAAPGPILLSHGVQAWAPLLPVARALGPSAGVFAAGDCAGEGGVIAEAIRSGREAAAQVAQSVRRGCSE